MKLYTNSELLTLFERHIAQMPTPEGPQRLYAPIKYGLEMGGKRIRPTLLMLAYNLYKEDIERAIMPAMAVEIFHNFTLLHDDIMDNADMRRGKPSVFAKWGENVPILSGDAMLITAYKMLAALEAERLPRVMHIFNDMALEVCEGQQYDMDFESMERVSVEDYILMIERKTSALLSGSAMIGATLAGASDDDIKKLYRFATELGLAFQLQDDMLDSFGDESLGKKSGGDILEGKQTYLMVQAMSRASDKEREVLRTTHKNEALTDAEKIATVKALYEKLDVKHATEQQIELRFERALAVLNTLSIAGERTVRLEEFARNLMGRKK